MNQKQAEDLVASLYSVSGSIDRLGNNDAATRMGAIEAHGALMFESAQLIAGGLQAIADALNGIAAEIANSRT